MRQMLLTVSAVTLMVGVAFAETETPMIDQRQVNAMESRAKFDGVMTEKERARILAAQDRAARHIEREKHVRKGKRHK